MSKISICLDYIWLDNEKNFRSKIKVWNIDTSTSKFNGKNYDMLPEWTYDGSSTKQADGEDSEIVLKPVAIFPKLAGHGYYVLCATYNLEPEIDNNGIQTWKYTPTRNNTWHNANEVFEKYKDEKPWYGLEQEYFINPRERGGIEQGQYYCSVGHDNCFYREIAEEHMEECLKCGINISGINAEVAPNQWEFQVGPVEGIHAANQLLLSRYLLIKLCEKKKVRVNFHPKPLYHVQQSVNGSGCHTNFSTENMRKEGGMTYIQNACSRLEEEHKKHMENYGIDNELRMSGECETAKFDTFSSGKADRISSVRIPLFVERDGYGYFEDRRPASNCDPYLVTSLILETTCKDLTEKTILEVNNVKMKITPTLPLKLSLA
jgi:glutamine synthetase